MTERRKSNLGKILRRLSDETTDRTSIVNDINKACVEGVTSTGAFSVLGVKRKTKELLKVLNDTPFDRDKFFTEFIKLYSLALAPDKRAKGVFHPSQLLDGCERQMAYDLMSTPPTDIVVRKIGAELQRTFDVGTWYHLYVQSILYQMGYLEQAEVPVVNKDKFINGKADGVIKSDVFGERVVLEIKTMNSWNFKKAVFRPFKKHEFQASIYARELGIKKVLYLYINKDTSEIKDFLCPIDEEQLALADKKMDSIIESVRNKELPKGSCKDKFCDNALACPFVSLCFKE